MLSFLFSSLVLSVFIGSSCPVLCTTFNRTIEVRTRQKLGLQLGPDLEILSLSNLSEQYKSIFSGIYAGDRIVGINGQFLRDDLGERSIGYFTSTISKITLPYMLHISYANSSQPRNDFDIPPPSQIYHLIVRHEAESHLNISCVPSVESKRNGSIFSCDQIPLVVAEPLSACGGSLGSQTGEIKGSYVIVSRGFCTFEAKLDAVKLFGGAGVIVINSDDRTFEIPVERADRRRTLSQRQIPMVMISKIDGELLLQLLSGASFQHITASSHGFRVRGGTGNSVVARLMPTLFCERNLQSVDIFSKPNIMNSPLRLSRGNKVDIFEPMAPIYEPMDDNDMNSTKDRAKTSASFVSDETTGCFATELTRLKALKSSAPAMFRDHRKQTAIFNQISSSFNFDKEQLHEFRRVIFDYSSSINEL